MTFDHLRSLRCLLIVMGCGIAAQTPPNVTRLDPAHLAIAVNAQTQKTLVIEFDQDMDQSMYSVCGGGPTFPEVDNVSWHGPRKLVIRAKLEPDRVYLMDLSCSAANGFFSAQGQRLDPVPWRIATAGPGINAKTRDATATALFRALRDHYSYRDRLGIDWSDFELRSYDAIASAPSMAAMALRISELLATPEDPHISIRWLSATLPTFRRTIHTDFDARLVQKSLTSLRKVGQTGLQGRTDDDIGYLLVGTFSRRNAKDIELSIAALRKMLDCKGIIIDIRTNGGGDETLALQLASFFVEGKKVYAAHRYRDPKADDGFGSRRTRHVSGNLEPDLYRGPVAVLMSRYNMSSSEAFLLMMKQARRATLIGQTSYGSSGNPKPRLLAPGLSVLLPSWQALRPDGSCFEGEGINPTVPVMTSDSHVGDRDLVLEEALQRLRRR